MSIKLTRCEKDSDRIIFRIEYKNDLTSMAEYKEVILTKADFTSFPPTKAEVLTKIKAVLNEKPTWAERLPDGKEQTIIGKSILEQFKESTKVVPLGLQKISSLEGVDISAVEI